ncbi:MAG: membrane protein insertase YidC [Treponema sp.]|jgi:YidC/Oxa1 family membrane protein insertase|nr:membrane protein insertase YidC [Treponema sp.]
MLTVLFDIIISPVKLVIECIYAVLSVSIFKDNIGISLAGLSIAVNILCLPLYIKAEQLQQAERAVQKKMAKRIASIKKHFKGDEQYMLLSMYYRENHYHPIMALRSSLSLLLQIPFFIAAYSFLSHLEALTGKSLFFIQDLGAEDAFFTIAGFSVNILPVIMTLINVAAGAIYSRGLPAKDKIQLYCVSGIFLVLLYHSPAALVVYWTMNNLFSLFKNILFKTRNPLKIVYILGLVLCAAFMIYVLFFRYNNPKRVLRNQIFAVSVLALFSLIPVFLRLAKTAAQRWLSFLFVPLKNEKIIFVFSCVTLWILTGCFIPFNLVASDPVQFALIPGSGSGVSSPFALLLYPAIQALGLFIFWPVSVFFLAPAKSKPLLSVLSAAFALCAIMNFFVFQGDYGIISKTLTFNLGDGYYLHDVLLIQLLNILACASVFIGVSLVVFFKQQKWLSPIMGFCSISFALLCVVKTVTINTGIARDAELQKTVEQNTVQSGQNSDTGFATAFTLSRTGKNVFVIMLDMAINSYFPLLLEERPALRKGFDGFVYYPNTASFYGRTLFGAPPLFGGYEYTPYNMNKRSDKPMKDKNNEALLLMPAILKEHNFDITISGLPYLNYGQPLENDFFSKRGIKNIGIEGKYTDTYIHDVLGLDEYTEVSPIDKIVQRNMLMFAILETSVFTLRDIIHQNGNYWSTADHSASTGISRVVLDRYSALYYLPQTTEVKDENGGGGTLSILVSDLTHDGSWLSYPDYTAEAEIKQEHGDNLFKNDSFKLYHVNAASYILLARWFDWLRAQNVWDNTRIIIVSDHGEGGITNPAFSAFQNNHTLRYNPILLFKDFNAKEPMKTSNNFMTNADVPFLALKDVVENPVNPFTGKPLNAGPEKDGGIYIFTEGYTNTSFYTGTTCLEDNSKFYRVHGSIFDDNNNWAEVRYKDFKDKQ